MLQQRLNDLRNTLKNKNLDGFLTGNFFNVLYLSGFKTLTENEREAWFLLTRKNYYLFSDSRYLDQKFNSKNNGGNLKIKYKLISPKKSLIKHLKEIFNEEEISSCGIEAEDLRVSEYRLFDQNFKKTKFLPTEQLIIKQRVVKDDSEVQKIKRACQASDLCLKDIIKTIKIGQTEKEIAFRIEFWLKEKGFDLAFYPIVAIDKNSALAHYDTRSGGSEKVKNGSVVLIDFGAKYMDYLSDVTRVVFFGKQNTQVLNTYNHLLNIQAGAIGKVRAGTSCKEVDSFCRNNLNFYHSTGHGVGLEIHEYPKISPVSEEKLSINQVITIEPGEYFEGKWGMRIEDTVVVKENGAEVFTKFNKQILQIN